MSNKYIMQAWQKEDTFLGVFLTSASFNCQHVWTLEAQVKCSRVAANKQKNSWDDWKSCPRFLEREDQVWNLKTATS